jgi:SAM-dependent methyltransferase
MHHVPDHGIILDIGSGHNPFPRATILSDRFLEITSHRREEIVLDGRPFVILDIHHLPFKTKSIDYIYCSHVIEHVDNPEQACTELMRVGKAGYIEAPTLMKDALFSWAKELTHRWYLVQFGNRLVFFEYDERRWQGVRSTKWCEAILSSYYHPNQDLFYPNQDLFNTVLEWTDRFDVTVFRLDQAQVDFATLNLESQNRRKRIKSRGDS